MDNFQKYLDYKLIQTFMNCDDIFYKLDAHKEILVEKSFMDTLCKFVDEHVKTNELDKQQLRNILEVVDYVKHNSKFCDINRINEMIVAINSSNGCDKLIYYIENYMSRFEGHGIIKNINTASRRQQIKSIIKKSNYLDYYYLIILTSGTDEEFLEVLEETIFSEYFLLSINQIIYEYPQISENPTFLKRLKTIVKINLEAKEQILAYENGKTLVKRSKFYYKQLKEE